MTSMNISLPEELKEYVEKRTQGAYSTPSEFIRDLIRQDRKQRAQEHLEDLIQEGLNSEPIVADENFWADFKAEISQGRKHRATLHPRRK